MNNATARPGIDHRRTAALVAEAIAEHEDIIWGIDGLRALGDAGAESLTAVLAIPSLRKLMLSWQLVEALADGDNVDLEAHLIEQLGYDYATYVRAVLFPEEVEPVRVLSVVG